MEVEADAGCEETVDFLVIGAGAAGMTAALVASIEGLRVLLIEKTALAGGATATSAGTIWAPGGAGDADALSRAETYLNSLIPNGEGSNRRRAFLSSCHPALKYLAQHSELQFAQVERHPDYYPGQPEASEGGRAFATPEFDGRRLGPDFARIRPPHPDFMVLGGMMAGKEDIPALLKPLASPAAFRRAARLLLRYLADRLRYPRGTRLVMGNALVARLLISLRAHGVDIRFRTQLVRLLVSGGAVAGAVIAAHEGREHKVWAGRGVFLGAGGFSGNPSWRERYLPEAAAGTVAFAGDTADGLEAAVAVGGRLKNETINAAYWMPSSVRVGMKGPETFFPHIFLDRAKPGLIAVNRQGRRFVNEADSYHDFVLAMFDQGNDGLSAWLVCDAKFLWRYGLGRVRPHALWLRGFINSGYLATARSIGALAARLKVPAVTLEATIVRYNRFAREGVDPDFAKGSSILNRHNGDLDHRPSPCLAEIRTAPFFAVEVWPTDLGTAIGLDTTEDGQVIAESGRAIPSLYAGGNDMASIMNGAYPGPGATLGPGIVFAWRSALHATKSSGQAR